MTLLSSRQFWAACLIGIFGLLFGLGVFTFNYAEGASYLSDNPETCLNCHVMREEYDGWLRSSHRSVATCNDCHIPHQFPDKWIIKGMNGWNHSRAFTAQDFHEPIQITEFNANITLESCLYCHESYVSEVMHSPSGEPLNCIACHGSVGHDEFPGIASQP